MTFYGGKIGSFRACVAGIVDAIATGGPSNAMGIVFFGVVRGHDTEVSGFASFGNIASADEKDGVGADDVLVTLGKLPNFFGIRLVPNVTFRIFGEFRVFGDLAGLKALPWRT
jgi:hypothetical protein